MELNNEYQTDEFLDFVEKDFLSDFKRDIRPVNVSGLSSIKKATYLGESKNLDLQVFEFIFEGSPNKRVALTKDAFTVMRSSAIFKSLAVFHTADNKDWRFSLLTATPGPTEKGKVKVSYSNPKRLSFFLGPNARIKTPTKFLIHKGKVVDFEDLKSRFSVEIVNKEFYNEISQAFTELVNGLLKLPSTEEKSQTNLEFAVRLIGRIIFCWFLREKKSSAGLSLMPKELLSLEAVNKNQDYYHKILEPIFFEVLNKPIKSRIDDYSTEPFSYIPYLNGGLFSPQRPDDYYERANSDLQSRYHNTLIIPDSWFLDFFNILETYNFTIDENTGYDEELSIDPEMLGRIFENLLAEINPETGESARKSTGSYYTPRTIVNYMVDESLLLYLKGQTGIEEEKLRAAVSYDLSDDSENPINVEEKEKITEALEKVKILDPACGSGAFPIGALQKIVFILQQVDPQGKLWFKKQIEKTPIELRRVIERKFNEENFDYIRKLGVIRENIYGVDIQPIATEISRLRCFLTLIVDESIQDEEENRGIEPLPNLDFKFVTANSLIGLPKLESNTSQQSLILDDRENIDELKNIRDQYFNSSGIEREQLKLQFSEQQKVLIKQMYKEHGFAGMAKSELTQKLTDWEPFTHKTTGWFDPEWMFGIKNGIDIIIANPPYVEFKNLGKEIKDTLEKTCQTTTGKYDLYVPFYEKAIQLLKNKGILTFISPTRYLHRSYGESLRDYILKNTAIRQILDFVDHQVFNTVLTYTGVFTLQKGYCNSGSFKYIKLKQNLHEQTLGCLNDKSTFEEIAIDQSKLGLQPWYISNNLIEPLLKKISQNKSELINLCEGIFQGIATGKDKVFIISNSTVAKYHIEPELLVRFLKGKDISKYVITWENIYLIYPYKVDGRVLTEEEFVSKYPNGYKYLLDNKNLLRGRDYFDKSNKYWFELWNQRNLNRFCRNKIITLDNAKTNSFAYDDSNFIGSTTTYSVVLKDPNISYKYILGLLNSKLLDFYHKNKTIPQAGGYFRYQAEFIKSLPIAVGGIDNGIKSEIASCVEKILELKNSVDFTNKNQADLIKEYEKQIDWMVYKLYDLTPEEIKIVENS